MSREDKYTSMEGEVCGSLGFRVREDWWMAFPCWEEENVVKRVVVGVQPYQYWVLIFNTKQILYYVS